MQIGMPAARPRNRESESRQCAAVPRANDLTTNFRRQREDTQRHQLIVRKSPHLFLQRDTFAKFFQLAAIANRDGVRGHAFSWRFDSCHSDSISSSDAVDGLLPCWRSLASR